MAVKKELTAVIANHLREMNGEGRRQVDRRTYRDKKHRGGRGVRGREEQRKGAESDRQMDRRTFMCTHTHILVTSS